MKKYSCPSCSYQSDLWSVKRHIERIHKNTANERTPESQHKKESLPNAQHGCNTGETQSIPIQEYNRVVEIANKWKNECDKIQDFREEDGGYFLKHTNYLENLLNLNNINYKNYESY